MFAVSRFTSRSGHGANHKYCFTRVTALTVNQSLCGVTFLTELVWLYEPHFYPMCLCWIYW